MKRCLLVGLAATVLGTWGCAAPAQDESGEEFSRLGEEHAQALTESLGERQAAAASFTFPLPEGWITEAHPLPPPWDPSHPFTGSEELRFPPGWPDPSSGQWWSYDFLLWIDSGPAITTSLLEDTLVSYYRGLADSCISVPCDPSKFAARLRRVVATPALTVFTGETDIFDSLGTPITLNMVISSVVCPRSRHRALLFSASPFPASAPIWRELLALQLQFRCT